MGFGGWRSVTNASESDHHEFISFKSTTIVGLVVFVVAVVVGCLALFSSPPLFSSSLSNIAFVTFALDCGRTR